MNLTPSEAKRLGIDAVVSEACSVKIKGDKDHGRILCEGLIQEVYHLTGVVGATEVCFHPVRKWRFDTAWQSCGKMVAVELNGWTSHHRKGRIREDNVKHAAAVRLGWMVLYADVDQLKRHAALWVAECLQS